MKAIRNLAIPLAAALMTTATAAHAALPANFDISIEAAGVQNTTAGFDFVGVETFNSLSTGQHANYLSTFGGSSSVTGTYSSVNIRGDDVYGGAGGVGNYAVAGLNVGANSYSVGFSEGVNYFGYWLSALDSGNSLSFYSGSTLLGSFNPVDVLGLVGSSGAYFGNPNGGGNSKEPYVFVNFFLNGEANSFDKIVFNQTTNSGAGYESDNHTVGWWNDQGEGTPVPGVPEPATWLTMIAGFGLVGFQLRRRRSNQAVKAIA